MDDWLVKASWLGKLASVFWCMELDFFSFLSKTMGCFSWHLISSASDQKLFCGVCSVFKCSFDELVGEKVISLSYSSTILAPPSPETFKEAHSVHFSRVGGGDGLAMED